MIYLQDPDFTLYHGEAGEVLATLPPTSVDCIVTSPPYWGLRDYQTGSWQGGDEGCLHEAARKKTRYDYSLATSPIHGKRAEASGTDAQAAMWAESCPTCGAVRVDQQIGLESTPDEFVEKLVEVFRKAKRVLKAEGTCWVNIGDTYHGGGGGNYGSGASSRQGGQHLTNVRNRIKLEGIKPKDLVGVPWRFALAMQADGWYLRADVIWAKKNCMPESCRDRPTRAHEYIFLFTQLPNYYYNYEATLEPHTSERWGGPIATNTDAWKGGSRIAERDGREYYPEGGRNMRSVWEMATESLPDAHYAPYPQELVRRCVTAGCPEGGVVLDPFLGSGTTAFVARRMHRRAIGIELSKEYCELISRRTQQQSLFAVQEEAREGTSDNDAGSGGGPGHSQPALPTGAA